MTAKKSTLNGNTCITPGCYLSIYARGLCFACYNAAARYVAEGKTTWAKLEVAGKSRARKTNRGTGTKQKFFLGK